MITLLILATTPWSHAAITAVVMRAIPLKKKWYNHWLHGFSLGFLSLITNINEFYLKSLYDNTWFYLCRIKRKIIWLRKQVAKLLISNRQPTYCQPDNCGNELEVLKSYHCRNLISHNWSWTKKKRTAKNGRKTALYITIPRPVFFFSHTHKERQCEEFLVRPWRWKQCLAKHQNWQYLSSQIV